MNHLVKTIVTDDLEDRCAAPGQDHQVPFLPACLPIPVSACPVSLSLTPFETLAQTLGSPQTLLSHLLLPRPCSKKVFQGKKILHTQPRGVLSPYPWAVTLQMPWVTWSWRKIAKTLTWHGRTPRVVKSLAPSWGGWIQIPPRTGLNACARDC